MNSVSSASIGTASTPPSMSRINSWYQRSRPGFMRTSSSRAMCVSRATTTQCSMVEARSMASSALFFSGTSVPLRCPPSAVISTFAPAALIRSASDSGLKPPNTTEWTAPMRVQASMAMAASGTMGR